MALADLAQAWPVSADATVIAGGLVLVASVMLAATIVILRRLSDVSWPVNRIAQRIEHASIRVVPVRDPAAAETAVNLADVTPPVSPADLTVKLIVSAAPAAALSVEEG